MSIHALAQKTRVILRAKRILENFRYIREFDRQCALFA